LTSNRAADLKSAAPKTTLQVDRFAEIDDAAGGKAGIGRGFARPAGSP
jgi:hypothetical protein